MLTALRVLGYPVLDEADVAPRTLPNSFAAPEHWALAVQLGFLGNRLLAVLRIREEQGGIVFIERSVSEDAIFFQRWAERVKLPLDVVSAYYRLHLEASRMARPDAYVHLSADSEVCATRILEDQRQGKRPKIWSTFDDILEYVEDLRVRYRIWEGSLLFDSKLVFTPGHNSTIEESVVLIQRWLSEVVRA